MKKLLLLGLTLVLSLSTVHTSAQSIQSVTITTPILCYGDLATINILINQSSPTTVLKLIVGTYSGTIFIPTVSTNNTTVINVNVPSLAAQNYTIRIVDSASYYSSLPFFPLTYGDPSDPTSIYDFTTINITQPLQLTNTISQNTSLLCFGDCNAEVFVNILGGIPPYSVTFGQHGFKEFCFSKKKL